MPMVFLTACAASAPTVEPAYLAEATLYRGAMVWGDNGFERRDFAVSGGAFVDATRAPHDAVVVDLSDHYVIPPMANAHQHITNLGDAANNLYMTAGVFYAWNPNNVASIVTDEARRFFARSDTYDTKQALGGITEPGGHPERLYIDILSQWVYQGKDRDFFLDNAFHYGGSTSEIDAALDRLVEQGADFVKIYVLHSEEYEKRRADDKYYGAKGLNPDNVAYLVDAAHRRDLPVAAHIETAADFRVTVAAGVDMLAHLPAYTSEDTVEGYAAKTLTDADATAAAAAGVTIVPTYALARARYDRLVKEGKPVDQALIDAQYATQAANLRRLLDAGVPVLTGTDSFIEVTKELHHCVDIGAMTRREAVEAALGTGALLFPERRLGRIEPGFEADFLVLEGNPLDGIDALDNIALRVKAGVAIKVSDLDQGEGS